MLYCHHVLILSSLPHLAKKNTGYPGESEFQIDNEYFFSIRVCTMQYSRHTYAKTLLIIYLKFTLSWASYILSDHSTVMPILTSASF